MYNFKKILFNIKLIVKLSFIRNTKNASIEGIVFSKDRPMQLFALLESYFKYCSDPAVLYVLYKTSNVYYDNGYNEVINYFRTNKVTFIKEKQFKKDLIQIINNISSKYIFYLVDDIIFKTSFSFCLYTQYTNRDKYIFSLRMGKNLNYCYTRQIKQNLPHFTNKDNFISWEWRYGEHDWNYVFSVDGNIYDILLIREMTKVISFKAPNSYEAEMNIFKYILRKKRGLCFNESILVNVCLNRVQNEIQNISGNISTQDLLLYWQSLKKIDINYFKNIDNKSAHIEVISLPLIFR